ncbi:VOC family protein, partial [Pseudomonas syringae pv. tagetis]
VSPVGVGIFVMFNGVRGGRAQGVVRDAPLMLAGMTHRAFGVDGLHLLERGLDTPGGVVTEGPHPIGPRRVAGFSGDPEGMGLV